MRDVHRQCRQCLLSLSSITPHIIKDKVRGAVFELRCQVYPHTITE